MLQNIRKMPSGRVWAYLGVILGFAASVTANVASTVLRDTSISLALRVPFAVLWPVFTYVAIEVLVRTDWVRRASHILARLVIIVPVGVVAAFVSYLHQHHLMILAGEPGMAQLFGPLAIDGMLFGMTATLIITRRQAPIMTETPEEILSDPASNELERELAALMSAEQTPAPVVERKPRASRASWDWRQVAELAMNGEPAKELHAKLGVGLSTAGRYTRVARMLREDATTIIDSGAERVHEDHVAFMRSMARVAR